MKDEKTYSILTECTNCGAWGQEEILKGVEKENHFRITACIYCGCRTIQERSEVVPTEFKKII